MPDHPPDHRSDFAFPELVEPLGPGLHLLHKPVGPTSFEMLQAALAAERSVPARGRPRLCHGGALDPFAHGLLLMLVGPATRLFEHLHAVPKVYEATVRWGIETDNGDPLGQPTFSGGTSTLTPARLDEALASFVGWQEQTPPATSNKRVDGERAYVRAHRGEKVELPPSRVYLHEARWLGHDLPRTSRLRVSVRGGFYVRALARDLGRLMGCGAHLAALRRTAIGPWPDPGPGERATLHGRDILPWASSRVLDDNEVGELRRDRPIPPATLYPPDWPLPVGFPTEPQGPIRGLQRQKLLFLLTPGEEGLGAIASFRGGL
ncbi:MAG: tRNA pseudouridine(55) synthase [Planctomycetota bacterium]|nr:tRNA pseudouridine(55) synthase [Planctomycetota bacterium]